MASSITSITAGPPNPVNENLNLVGSLRQKTRKVPIVNAVAVIESNRVPPVLNYFRTSLFSLLGHPLILGGLCGIATFYGVLYRLKKARENQFLNELKTDEENLSNKKLLNEINSNLVNLINTNNEILHILKSKK